MLESAHPGGLPPVHSFAGDSSGPVMITALKGSEDPNPTGGTDMIVRAVETTGQESAVRLELPLLGRHIEETFGPYQIRTFRVPVHPNQPITETDLLERPLTPAP